KDNQEKSDIRIQMNDHVIISKHKMKNIRDIGKKNIKINLLEQTHVYEYLVIENDPLYNEILSLQVNQSVDVQGIMITRTAFEMYEIESKAFHEGFTSSQSIYKRVSAILNTT